MNIGKSLAAPAKLLGLFVVLAGIPLIALGWLGWRLIEQDLALEDRRLRERLENSSTLAVRELERGMAAWEDLLPARARESPVALPPDTVRLVFDAGGLLAVQGVRLPYYPDSPSPPATAVGVFAPAERLEFREGQLAKAAAAYRSLSLTRDPRVRAEALMRLARCLSKLRQFKDAFAAYGELAALGDTPVAGSPAALVARGERVELLTVLGDKEGATREAALLASAVSDGQLRMDRATFDFYRASSLVPAPDASALGFAEAVRELWPTLQRQVSGRGTSMAEGRAFAAVWRHTPTGTAAIVGGIDRLMASVSVVMESLEVRLALEDPSGRTVWGALPADGDRFARTFQETGLPWTMRIAASDPAGAREASTRRRNLLSAGFGLMVLVIAAAGYLMYRAVSRELGVARLQSDFVAAVSHEFRTPLTAIRHFTDMLEEGGAEADRLPRYYTALGREARRLHTMVESLLDFERMESGRRTYQMQETSAAELARQVVDEFREHASVATGRVEMYTSSSLSEDQSGGEPRIRADRDAIALALRNLLDNAVKYSAESSTVSVSVRSQGSLTGISVEDRGAGITKQEQRDVFRKFVRGTAAHTLNVKGTGIGLAMVDQIVKAHGGRLELLSEPGRGSRFTMWLPETKDREARDVGAVLSGRAGGSPRGASGGGAPRATRE